MLVVDSLRCCLTWTVEAITQSRNLRDKAARGREGEAAKQQGQRLGRRSTGAALSHLGRPAAMHIKEVVIDGFKSYATRTVLQGFDQQFNAITGLNGSGKSNILDAICFVLGISNLSQVRVSNLQELVYKQGQAGVTKASVTLVFSNVDKKGRCVGALVCMCLLAAQGKSSRSVCVCVQTLLPTHGEVSS